MKKRLFLLIIMTVACSLSFAQNYAVVNTQTIFSKIPAYVAAQEKIETYTEAQQVMIDEAYVELEEKYNQYQLAKKSMTPLAREAMENEIIADEKRINDFQRSIFGEEGKLMKMRTELFKPIEDKVTTVINSYAAANKIDIILDISNNASVLFYSKTSDKTEEIIILITNTK